METKYSFWKTYRGPKGPHLSHLTHLTQTGQLAGEKSSQTSIHPSKGAVHAKRMDKK